MNQSFLAFRILLNLYLPILFNSKVRLFWYIDVARVYTIYITHYLYKNSNLSIKDSQFEHKPNHQGQSSSPKSFSTFLRSKMILVIMKDYHRHVLHIWSYNLYLCSSTRWVWRCFRPWCHCGPNLRIAALVLMKSSFDSSKLQWWTLKSSTTLL